MRISDWSSDVCSSDLYLRRSQPPLHPGTAVRSASSRPAQAPLPSGEGGDPLAARPAERLPLPSALPACHRSLPRRAAGPSRNRGRALVRLPSPRLTMAEKENDPPFDAGAFVFHAPAGPETPLTIAPPRDRKSVGRGKSRYKRV